MKKLLGLTAVLLGTCLSAVAGESGAQLYKPCIACHGVQGEGNVALNAPALAGQLSTYLERQLNNFNSGRRGSAPGDTFGAQMKPMAASLATEQAINDVAAYLSAMPVTVSAAAPSGDLRNGNNYYHANCGACHGGKAEGNARLNAPRLSGLDTAYLKRQYGNFQQGRRGSHPDDRFGRQMKMMSTSLPTEKDLDDVIAFIHTLGSGGQGE